MYKIGFIGAGNMAKAIIRGMIKNGFHADNISVFDIDTEKYKQIDEKLDAKEGIADVVQSSDIIFLAVKPQNYDEVLKEVKPVADKNKTFVSIAAGISSEYIENKLSNICHAIRVMPNTPLLLSKGAVAIAKNNKVSSEIFDTVKNIFEISSHVELLPEKKMNEVIAVNGSSPAYVYLFAKAVIDYAKEVGIDENVALNLTAKTLIGSAEMITKSGYSIDELIKMVSSPGGTTLAALDTLEQYNFYDGIKEAMKSCTKRANELSQ